MSDLGEVLKRIGDEFKDEILPTARTYCAVNIGKAAEIVGKPRLKDKYLSSVAIVPLRKVEGGINVEIDGNTLSNFAQLDSGIAVSESIAKESGLPYKPYKPQQSMLLNLRC